MGNYCMECMKEFVVGKVFYFSDDGSRVIGEAYYCKEHFLENVKFD